MRPGRLVWIAAPVVVVALMVGLRLAVKREARRRSRAEEAVSVQAQVTAGTPAGRMNAVVAGVPAGFSHDRTGAISASLGFLSVGPSVIAMDDAAAMAAQRQMSTSGTADAMVADLRSRLAAMHDGFGPGRIGYRLAPLAVRADQSDGDHVDVAVWYVAVVEPPGTAAYADWRIVRYELVWERSDWHEAAEHDEPGPRPAAMTVTPPTPLGSWAEELEGFNAIGMGHA